ncbi:MAG: APC family permease [Nitrososphaerota archaeon]|jgi:amino acid transporter|nr:APC family permease [Nitrososphaerota archaeon]MDG6932094.1 APC family permease [Nitrososphaerota archaeon]MDG6935628.1 APC family permease [Nitrososphaerota archaeon]MDG6943543.1 APC family permease [Nitrososphaerota archaeon]
MFKRNASGLVKALKMRDVFIYNSLTISLFSMMWFLLFIFQPVAFTGGSIVLGTALLAIVAVPFFITYSYLSRAYPLAGGDYIFQSRTMHPVVGFVFTFTGWVLWQLFFIAWFGYYIVDALLLPYLYFMSKLTGSWVFLSMYGVMNSRYFVFFATAILLAIAFLISMRGLRFYVKVQYLIFILMVAGGVSALAILFGHDSYHVISAAASLGSLGSINWLNTIGTWSLSWGAVGYGMWSVLNNEEISGSESRKKYSAAMVGAVLLNVFYVVAVWVGLKAAVGYAQLSQLSQLWYSGRLTGMLATVGAPYYTVLMAFLNPNPILYTVLIVGAAVSMFQVMIAIMIGSSRIVLAQSLDGILPIKLATVQDRSHSPIYSLAFDLFISMIWLVLIVFMPSIGPFFVSVVFATQVTWMFSMISGMIKAKRERNPGILIASAIGFLLNAVIAAFYIIYPQLGFMSITSMLVVSGLFAVAFIYFAARNLYLKRKTGFTIKDRVKEL